MVSLTTMTSQPSRARCSPQQAGEVRRAGFLLALDQQLEGDRRRRAAGRGEAGTHPERVEEHLALVVRGAAPQQPAALLGRLERGVTPFVQRLNRLHVVMAVNEHDRGGRVLGGPFGEDGRLPGTGGGVTGLPDLRHGEPGVPQTSREPLRGFPDIIAARGIRRNRWDGQPRLEIGEKTGRVRLDVGTGIHGATLARPAGHPLPRRPVTVDGRCAVIAGYWPGRARRAWTRPPPGKPAPRRSRTGSATPRRSRTGQRPRPWTGRYGSAR